jgi:hypothetical protein
MAIILAQIASTDTNVTDTRKRNVEFELQHMEQDTNGSSAVNTT